MPLATPTVLFGFLLPWAWGISSRLLLTLDDVAPPDLGRGVALLGHSPCLGHGVAQF